MRRAMLMVLLTTTNALGAVASWPDKEWPYTTPEAVGLAPEFLKEALTPHIDTGTGWKYGYKWWLYPYGSRLVWTARGFGGQQLMIFPEDDLIVVTTAWDTPGGNADLPTGLRKDSRGRGCARLRGAALTASMIALNRYATMQHVA